MGGKPTKNIFRLMPTSYYSFIRSVHYDRSPIWFSYLHFGGRERTVSFPDPTTTSFLPSFIHACIRTCVISAPLPASPSARIPPLFFFIIISRIILRLINERTNERERRHSRFENYFSLDVEITQL